MSDTNDKRPEIEPQNSPENPNVQAAATTAPSVLPNPSVPKKSRYILLALLALVVAITFAIVLMVATQKTFAATFADKTSKCGHEPALIIKYPSGGLGSHATRNVLIVPDNPDYKSSVDNLKQFDNVTRASLADLLGGHAKLLGAYCSGDEARHNSDGISFYDDQNNDISSSIKKARALFSDKFYMPSATLMNRHVSGLVISKDGAKYSFALSTRENTSGVIDTSTLFTCQMSTITQGLIYTQFKMKPDPGAAIVFEKTELRARFPTYRANDITSISPGHISSKSKERILSAFPYIQAEDGITCYFEQFGDKIDITKEIIDSVALIKDFNPDNYQIELAN